MTKLMLIQKVFSLLWLIHYVVANTEVTIIERKSSADISKDKYYDLIRTHEFPMYNHSVLDEPVSYISLPVSELNYTVLSVNVMPLQFIDHEENHNHPWNNLQKLTNYERLESSRYIYIKLDNLDEGVYFTRLSWSAISPVGIDINQLNNDLFLIKVEPDYYTSDLSKTKQFLEDVKLNLHILKNNRLFGLNDDLINIIKYMITLIVISLSLRKVFYNMI